MAGKLMLFLLINLANKMQSICKKSLYSIPKKVVFSYIYNFKDKPMLKILIFSLLFLVCFSCGKKVEESQTITPEIKIDTVKAQGSIKDLPETKLSHAISVEEIDSVSFITTKKRAPEKRPKPEKISDFKTVKKLLNGIVAFDDSEKYGDAPAVKKINFKNGTSFSNQDDFYEAYFIAYFPSEDILLCEGGHSTDVSFNLKNSKLTEETGNPNEILTSPNNKFRLTSHYGGQECSAYIIQKNNNGNFEKILQLDEEFEKITKLSLCTIKENFWLDDTTLFLSRTHPDKKGKFGIKYFKILIK